MTNKIKEFIDNFHGAENVFLNGCCYWFAFILAERFGGDICYNQPDGHFATLIDGKVYDITGEINKEGFIPLSEYKRFEPGLYQRLMKQCARKEN